MSKTSITATFGLDSRGLSKELNQIGKKIRSTANLWGKLLFAAGAATFSALARDALSMGSSLDDTAKKLGLTTDLIQELGYAGSQFGVNQETTNQSLQSFVRLLGEAQAGTGALLPITQQYGLALHDANGNARSATDVLGDFAEIIKRTRNPQEQLRLAVKAFGVEGAGLVNVLKDGKAGLKEWGAQAAEAGVVLNKEVIAKLAEAETAMANFKRRITVAVGNIIVNFRSEEGIKLLGLQLLKVAAVFTSKIADAAIYPAKLIYNVFTAAFSSVVANFKNGLISQLQFVATQVNKLLPARFEIDVAGLEQMKSAGTDISDQITRAIANTDPSALTDGVRTAYDQLITEQKGVISALTVAGVEGGDAIAAGGDRAAQSIKKGADSVATAADKAAARIRDAATLLKEIAHGVVDGIVSMKFSALNGATLAGLDTSALIEVARRTKNELNDLRNPALNPKSNGLGAVLTATSLEAQLSNALTELSMRQKLQNDVSRYGVDRARQMSNDPIVFEKLLRDFGPGSQDMQNRTLSELQKLNQSIASGIVVRDISG